MSNETDIPSHRLVRKTAAQVLADRRAEDEQRLRQTDAWSDEEITRRAREDPDNPPMTEEELAEMRPSSHRVSEVLASLEDADEAELADLLRGIADRLDSVRKAG